MTDETIYQAAHRLKKPSKREAAALVHDLYHAIGADAVQREHLARLFAYFRPAAPKRPKTAFQWVAQAMAGDTEVREYLRYVHVSADWIEASNGHRLHRIANRDGMAPGFYDCDGALIHGPDWRRYPEVSRVIRPEKDASQEPSTTEWHEPVGGLEAVKVGPVVVQAKYWEQANNLPDCAPIVAVFPDHLTVQVRDGVTGAQAVIMGLRL